MALIAIHPGEHLAEELDALKMSAAELARRLEVPTNRVTGILNGQRAITGDTALRLGHFFGTSAEFWLNLQSLYELRVAEAKIGKAIRKLPRLKHLGEASAHPPARYITSDASNPDTRPETSAPPATAPTPPQTAPQSDAAPRSVRKPNPAQIHHPPATPSRPR
jgi:antitoxin HigA-1